MYAGEVPVPSIGAGEVLVKVHATALNRADLLQRRGLYPPPDGESEILGLEMAGEVVVVGEGAGEWHPGDRVMALLAGGGYAECVGVAAEMLMRIPSNLSYEQAAAIPEAFLTAWQALDWLAGLQKGETVLLHAGASGVGTAAIQLAKIKGARIWTTASAGKHSLCLELGADECIDYRIRDFSEVILQKNKNGVQVVIDFIGAPYFDKNLRVMAPDGRMVMPGFLGGARTKETNLVG